MNSTNFFLDHEDILLQLLQDRSKNASILWNHLDENCPNIEITCLHVLEKRISPRNQKTDSKQKSRTKSQAEVFTPAWVCNIQNNLIDKKWFNGECPFNAEQNKSWKTSQGKIKFPNEKTWLGYIQQTRLEICCGEAPYLTSRYDSVTGEDIPVKERIGLLDRKLRVVSENTFTKKDWLTHAVTAIQNIYGYEKNGDSLFLARSNLLFSFIDFFQEKFLQEPSISSLKKIATIISWNLWQMDCQNEEDMKKIILMDWKTGKKTSFTSLLG